MGDVQRGPEEAMERPPKRPQRGPNAAAPKRPQSGPKEAPKSGRAHPHRPRHKWEEQKQETPFRAESKGAQRRLKEAGKRAERGPKEGRKRPKEGPERPPGPKDARKGGPTRPQTGPKRGQRGPRRAQSPKPDKGFAGSYGMTYMTYTHCG